MTKQTVLPVAATLAVLAALLVPILTPTYLPMVDISNHLARLYLKNGGGELPALAQYYTTEFFIIPNQAIGLLHAALGAPENIFGFARFTVALYAVNFVAALLCLHWVLFGQWSAMPVLAGLVVFNGPFHWGFQNFLFTMPFAIWGLVLWFLMEKSQTWARVLAFIPVGIALYFGHLFVFGAWTLLIFGREIQTMLAEREQGLGRAFLRRLPITLPFLIPLGMLFLLVTTGPENPSIPQTGYISLSGRIDAFMNATYGWAVNRVPGLQRAGLLAFLFLLLLSLISLRKRFGLLSLNPKMHGVLLVFFVFCLVAPFYVHGVSFFSTRFPFLLFGLLLASIDWRAMPDRLRTATLLAGVAIIVANSAVLTRHAQNHSAEIEGLIALGAEIEPGARVLPLANFASQATMRRSHSQSYLIIERQVFVPTLPVGTHRLRVHPEWRDYHSVEWRAWEYKVALFPDSEEAKAAWASGTPEVQYLENWPEKFQYVLTVDPVAEDLSSHPNLDFIASKGPYALYRSVP